MFPEAIREIAAFLAAHGLRLSRRMLPSEAAFRSSRDDSPQRKTAGMARKTAGCSHLGRRASTIGEQIALRPFRP
jgi:hypothetical protein